MLAKFREKHRLKLEVAGFVAFVAWIVFAGWCAVQNSERAQLQREADEAMHARCTCGALQ